MLAAAVSLRSPTVRVCAAVDKFSVAAWNCRLAALTAAPPVLSASMLMMPLEPAVKLTAPPDTALPAASVTVGAVSVSAFVPVLIAPPEATVIEFDAASSKAVDPERDAT